MKDKKLRFQLSLSKAKKGDKHPDISKIQLYLQKFGYLKDKCKSGELCLTTSAAIRKFQRFSGLSVTGTLNTSTTSAMMKKRCDNSDPVGQPARLVAGARVNFNLNGCKYHKTQFTYKFINGTNDIPGNNEQAAIRNALNTWASVVNIQFTEVARNRSSDFEFGWHSRHFDGVGNTLAHAYFPPDCGGEHAGKCHFDEAETWSVNGTGEDLESAALHEIGHLLGIEHSRNSNDVMFGTMSSIKRALTASDIDAVRSLYPIFTRLNDSGSLAGEIKSVKALRHNTQQVITAVRTANNTLKLISWRVNSAGRFTRSGDSGNSAGSASHIDMARIGNKYVTACRAGSGRLFLISWDVNASGSRLVRLDDSGRLAGTATKIKVVALTSSLLLTACRASNGKLFLITWRLNSDGSFTRLHDSGNQAGTVNDISLIELPPRGSSQRALTSVRMGNGKLRLIVWNIQNNGRISRSGDSRNQAGTASQINTFLHPSGRVITSCRSGSGRLFLISWSISNGSRNRVAINRVRDSGTLAGRISRNSTMLMSGGNSFVSGVRTAAGTLKLISFSLTANGRFNRIGDSANLAGEISEISMPKALAGNAPLISCVKAGNGRLMLISWRP